MTRLQRATSFLVLGLSLALAGAACGGESEGDGSGGAGAGSGGGGTGGTGGTGTPGVHQVFDHRHTALEQIPSSCLGVLTNGGFVFHYGHRSHGAQIIAGAESIEATNPAFGFDAEYCSVPSTTGVFRVWDGMIDNNTVQPEDYWDSEAGLTDLRTVLGNNPGMRYSMWAWSYEIAEQTEESVQKYLDTMSMLEEEFPDVTFIYMTGTAEEEYNGPNRAMRNQQIRDYCAENGKILYDFEDLDAWYNGERHTVMLEGVEVPKEHPQYDDPDPNGYDFTHTTQESCENKARAFWWMMASLNGCELP